MRIAITRPANSPTDVGQPVVASAECRWPAHAPPTLAELAAAVGLIADSHHHVVVDGRTMSPDHLVTDIPLVRGTNLALAPTAPIDHKPAEPGLLWFAVTGGLHGGAICTVPASPATLGRDQANGIVLNDPTVSRHHGHLVVHDDGRTVTVVPHRDATNSTVLVDRHTGTERSSTDTCGRPTATNAPTSNLLLFVGTPGGPIENKHDSAAPPRSRNRRSPIRRRKRTKSDESQASPTPGAHGAIALGASRAEVWATPTDPTSRLLGDATTAMPRRTIPAADGTQPWHRPPPVLSADRTTAVELPPEATVARPVSFSWAGALVPLAIGGAMGILLSPAMAMFALLSPVYAVATWVEARRRSRRDLLTVRRSEKVALDRCIAALGARHQQETAIRRTEGPSPAHLAHRVRTAAPTLWETRPHHASFLRVRVGLARRPLPFPELSPAAEQELSGPVRVRLRRAIEHLGPLVDIPEMVTFEPGAGIGICGPESATRAAARALVLQLTVLHGPADLIIHADEELLANPSWAWLTWLPHLVLASQLAADNSSTHGDQTNPGGEIGGVAPGRPAPSSALAAPVVLRIVAFPSPGSATAAVGANGYETVLAIALQRSHLPASCGAVLHLLDDLGHARLERLERATGVEHNQELANVDLLADGTSVAVAADTARRLARWTDPDLRMGQGLPARISIGDALGMEPDLTSVTAAVTAAWAQPASGHSLPAVLGCTETGTLRMDLVVDGPHALIAGTTGSGKSELIRTLVVGLAAQCSPEDVCFLLLDYKGGSAFDACVDLPHVVGVITDLDGGLAGRALVSLEVELRRREVLLRHVGADDLLSYRALATRNTPRNVAVESLPRLVVVIDEFASLAKELPHFLDALVSIAQRGRSLGVHLVLATQRPAGVVNDQIRTNTNLRIALRLLDAADAHDVVGSALPATLHRGNPGRGVVRRDDGDLVLFQTAQSSAELPATEAGIEVRFDGPSNFEQPSPSPSPSATEPGHDTPSTWLNLLVTATCAAAQHRGAAPPHRPWTPPLPPKVSTHSLSPSTATRVVLGITDDLARQQRGEFGWELLDGPLLVFGGPATGTTTTLLAIGLSLAEVVAPSELHLYALDHGSRRLEALASFPHTGAVIGPDEPARRRRLLRWLTAEVERRRAAGRSNDLQSCSWPTVVVLIDDLTSLLGSFDGLDGIRSHEQFVSLWREAHHVGVHLVATVDRPGAVPTAISGATRQRAILHLNDRYDLVSAGLPAETRTLDLADGPTPPGRGWTTDGLALQIACPDLNATDVVLASWTEPPVAQRAHAIGELNAVVHGGSLPHATADGSTWTIPLGQRDDTLDTAALVLHRGEHTTVAGAPRSGVSTLLTTIVVQLTRSGLPVLVVAGPHSPLTRRFATVDAESIADLLRQSVGKTSGEIPRQEPVIVIDDADRVPDFDGVLAAVASNPDSPVRLLIGARIEQLRASYGHWSSPLRNARNGVALGLTPDNDGDLWAVRFPRPVPQPRPGLGYLIQDASATLVQCAQPSTLSQRPSPIAGLASGLAPELITNAPAA